MYLQKASYVRSSLHINILRVVNEYLNERDDSSEYLFLKDQVKALGLRQLQKNFSDVSSEFPSITTDICFRIDKVELHNV